MNQKQFLVAAALSKLREARELLAEADAPRALDKVRRAMKSTEGALRHAGRGDLFPTAEDEMAERAMTADLEDGVKPGPRSAYTPSWIDEFMADEDAIANE